jgi:hypothetical protein
MKIWINLKRQRDKETKRQREKEKKRKREREEWKSYSIDGRKERIKEFWVGNEESKEEECMWWWHERNGSQ